MRSRSAYYGIIGMVWAFASGVGPILGGVFTQKVSWRWCFYINLPITGVVFFLILFFLKLNTPRTPLIAGLKAIDWLGKISSLLKYSRASRGYFYTSVVSRQLLMRPTGSLTIIGGTLMFLLGLEFGGVSEPWSSAKVLCLLIFGLITLTAIFITIEWKFASYPVIPLRIFSKMSNVAALLVCSSHGFVFISGSYYLPLYFQAVLGATPLLSGVYLLPFALTLSIGSGIVGVFIKKTGRYLECIYVGLFIMTLGVGLFIDLSADSSWAKIILYQIVAGFGCGPLFQAPLLALQASVSLGDIATATATFGFTRNLSTAISVVIGGVVFQNGMQMQIPGLIRALGPETAQLLGGGSAGANVMLVNALPPAQRTVAREAYAKALMKIWILYVCLGVAGLVASAFIRRQTLTKHHTETKTGLEAERQKRMVREQEAELAKKGEA